MNINKITKAVGNYLKTWQDHIHRTTWQGKLSQTETWFFYRIVLNLSRVHSEAVTLHTGVLSIYFNSSNITNGQEIISDLADAILEDKWLDLYTVPLDIDTPRRKNTFIVTRYDPGRAHIEGGVYKQVVRINFTIESILLD